MKKGMASATPFFYLSFELLILFIVVSFTS
nr:MAG TPA: hypothetical protein [Caudoviricetes sp.]